MIVKSFPLKGQIATLEFPECHFIKKYDGFLLSSSENQIFLTKKRAPKIKIIIWNVIIISFSAYQMNSFYNNDFTFSIT